MAAFIGLAQYSTRRLAGAAADAVAEAGAAAAFGVAGSEAPCGSQRNMGSSTLDWCFLAAGRYDLYLHGGQRLWDYAAGAVILEEAGGQIASLNTDAYWEDQPWKRSAIAALNPELFSQWLRWVRANQ